MTGAGKDALLAGKVRVAFSGKGLRRSVLAGDCRPSGGRAASVPLALTLSSKRRE